MSDSKLFTPRRWRTLALAISLLMLGTLAGPIVALASINGVVIGAQTPNPVTAGNVATFFITVTTDTDHAVEVTGVAGLPPGATWSSDCVVADSGGTTHITLSVPTTNLTAFGDYVITPTVQQYTETTCPGSTAGPTDSTHTATLSVRHAQTTLTLTGATSPAEYYDTQTLGTTGGSGTGLVTYSVGASTACSVATNVLTITASTGSCSVTATKAGDPTYNAKTSLAVPITVGQAHLTVAPDAKSVTYGGSAPTYSFAVTGFRNSETAVTAAGYVAPTCLSSYSPTTPVSSSPLTISCSGGSATNYIVDTFATSALTIGKAAAVCTSISGYSVAYDGAAHSATGTCQGIGSDGTLVGLDLSGTTHTAAGSYPTDPWTFTDVSGNYLNTSGTVADAIGMVGQTITFGALGGRTIGDANFTVAATASSGLTVAFSSLTVGVCTVSGTTVHLVAIGLCTIQAAQPGDGNWNAASPVSQSFNVAATGTVTRRAGSDRYATSAAISAATFAANVAVVYVATGENYPDALSGGPAAAAGGGPVLLVRLNSIPSSVATELTRLHPGRIVVLGGSSVVSDAVLTALHGYTTGAVTRISGADRYATAAAVSAASFAAGVPVAYVATGANYPDALSGGPAAAALGGPILLVTGTAIPAATATELNRLHPAKIIILGSAGVVSSAVETSLHGYTTGTVTRLSGSDRYATSAAISAATFAANVAVVYVATGENYPDALSGGPAAAAGGGPVLLVRLNSIPSSVAAELTRLHPRNIVVLGGPSVVSDTVMTALAFYLAP